MSFYMCISMRSYAFCRDPPTPISASLLQPPPIKTVFQGSFDKVETHVCQLHVHQWCNDLIHLYAMQRCHGIFPIDPIIP
jgi:hypothetical protein